MSRDWESVYMIRVSVAIYVGGMMFCLWEPSVVV